MPPPPLTNTTNTLPMHPPAHSINTNTTSRARSHLFRSRRLRFTALDPTQEADRDFYAAVQAGDVEALANSTGSLLRPQTRKGLDEQLQKQAEEELLCVGFELADRDGEVAGEQTKEEREKRRVRVGMLTLSGEPIRNAHHRCTEMAVDVLRAHQGKGYGTEAILWALRWAFQIAGLHRVEIDAFSYNPGAVRLYERLGFKKEGVQEEALWFDGRWEDVHCFAMLRDRWEGLYGDGTREAEMGG